MDDADTVGQVSDLGEDVARHEDGDAALVGERAEQLADLDDTGRIEAVGGLVEHEQFGGVQQCAGEGEALLVAERELPGAPVGVRIEAQQRDRVGDRPRRRTGEPALDVEVLAHGEVGVGGRGLNEEADAGEHARLARDDAPAEDGHLPAARSDQAEQHADGGRFTRPVPAEEPVDFAAADVEVERVDGGDVAVPLDEGARGNRGVRHGSPSWPHPATTPGAFTV